MAQRGKKKIKIWVDEDDGHITKVKLQKDDGSYEDSTDVNVDQPCQYVGTILFCKKSNPGNCIRIESGGYFWTFCW